ncbi:aminotransferase class I/II-fold pyridoxal phosphate-dependent enzyme [Bacillus thuringiensis]|nr:aminotransferase class I/II-fold pyridoxal phosphate-dependent enzyme [Bacillus thuringiensis]
MFKPGNRITTDLYTYSNFIELAKMIHIQLVPIQGNEFGMLPDELGKQCSQLDIHGILLISSCSNLTTIMIADFRKKELAVIIRKHHLILIKDDIKVFSWYNACWTPSELLSLAPYSDSI